jgi:glutamine amidotransferase
MCRWIAYRGEPILMEQLVAAPDHSLIFQSQHALESRASTNGDGFGVGWFGERAEPGLYREIRPAWSDENLRSICAQVRSRLFFAHVRASTGTASTRANCHPFVRGQRMFMHNGQIGDYGLIKRRLEDLIPDGIYASRDGTTDSEAIFLAAHAYGLEDDPVGAIGRTLARIKAMMDEAGARDPLRFTAALTDGRDLYAFRYASDDEPPSLYWQRRDDALIVVSEPLDGDRPRWHEVPKCAALAAKGGGEPVLLAFARF